MRCRELQAAQDPMTSKPERVPLDHAGLLQVLEMVQDGLYRTRLSGQ
jgi:hypothetical protein